MLTRTVHLRHHVASTWKRQRTRGLVTAILMGAALAGVSAVGNAAARHPRLLRSEPAKDTTVTASPTAVKLVFSEVVKPAVAGVRLRAGDSSVVTLGPLKSDERNPAVLVAPITGRLRAGAHRVQWRVTGADGHVITGDFVFTFKPPATDAP